VRLPFAQQRESSPKLPLKWNTSSSHKFSFRWVSLAWASLSRLSEMICRSNESSPPERELEQEPGPEPKTRLQDNHSRNYDNRAKEVKVLVGDWLTWSKRSLATSEKSLDQTLTELSVREKIKRKWAVLRVIVEWETKRLKVSLWGHPMGWPLSPTDKVRPLNFRAENKWTLQKSFG